MSALESLIAAGGEAGLLESLTYDIPPQSTAVVQRKQNVRFYPTSASSLSYTGVRTVRIRLGGNDWLDPNLRLQYTLQNTGAGFLAPVCGPWGPFGMVRLLCNSVEIDRIDWYNRFHELHGWRLLTMEQQAAEGVYGWSSAWTGTPHPNPGILPANASVTVSFKPLLSLFTSGKALPSRYCPVELEFSLTPNAVDWLAPFDHQNPAVAASQVFSINNIQVIADQLVLDEAVQASFYTSLLANRVLSIPITQSIMLQQNIPAGATSVSFNISRAFSRLSHIWLTFLGAGAATNVATSFVMPHVQDAGLVNSWGTYPNFTANTDVVNCPTVRLSIGPMNIPDPAPVSSMSEHWLMLQKALPGVPYLDRADFMAQTFVSAFDLRRVPGDPTSAISTRAGEMLRVDIKNITADVSQSVIVTLMAYSVVSVREAGITLLD